MLRWMAVIDPERIQMESVDVQIVPDGNWEIVNFQTVPVGIFLQPDPLRQKVFISRPSQTKSVYWKGLLHWKVSLSIPSQLESLLPVRPGRQKSMCRPYQLEIIYFQTVPDGKRLCPDIRLLFFRLSWFQFQISVRFSLSPDYVFLNSRRPVMLSFFFQEMFDFVWGLNLGIIFAQRGGGGCKRQTKLYCSIDILYQPFVFLSAKITNNNLK